MDCSAAKVNKSSLVFISFFIFFSLRFFFLLPPLPSHIKPGRYYMQTDRLDLCNDPFFNFFNGQRGPRVRGGWDS